MSRNMASFKRSLALGGYAPHQTDKTPIDRCSIPSSFSDSVFCPFSLIYAAANASVRYRSPFVDTAQALLVSLSGIATAVTFT